jgi:hypothetical protein
MDPQSQDGRMLVSLKIDRLETPLRD